MVCFVYNYILEFFNSGIIFVPSIQNRLNRCNLDSVPRFLISASLYNSVFYTMSLEPLRDLVNDFCLMCNHKDIYSFIPLFIISKQIIDH